MIETYAAAAEVAAANCRPIRPAIWAIKEWRAAQVAALSVLRAVSADEADAIVPLTRAFVRAAAICAAEAVGVLPDDMGRGLWGLVSSLKWEGRTIALPVERARRQRGRAGAKPAGLSGPEVGDALLNAGIGRSKAAHILMGVVEGVYYNSGCGPSLSDWAAVAAAQADFAGHEGYKALLARDMGLQAPWRS